MFDGPKTVSKVFIEWEYPAKTYDILFNSGTDWEPF